MKVILKKDVPNLGRAGDIKEVRNGYARNYLIPRGMVLHADPRSEKEKLFLENVRKRKIDKRKKTAEELSAAVNGKEVRITVKVGEEGRLFGSVTNFHIQKELLEQGFTVDRKNVDLPEPIKELGKYSIELKLYEGVTSQITVYVQDEEGNIEYKAPEGEEVAAASDAETAEESSAPVAEETPAETAETEETATPSDDTTPASAE